MHTTIQKQKQLRMLQSSIIPLVITYNLNAHIDDLPVNSRRMLNEIDTEILHEEVADVSQNHMIPRPWFFDDKPRGIGGESADLFGSMYS